MKHLTFGKRTKSFTLSTDRCGIRRWRVGIELDGRLYTGDGFRLQGMTEDEESLSVVLTGCGITFRIDIGLHDESPDTVLSMSGRITAGENSVEVGRIYLLTTDSTMSFGTRTGEIHVLSLSGSLTPRIVYRISDPECPRESLIKTQFAVVGPQPADDGTCRSRPIGPAFQVGFETFKRCNTGVTHQVGGTGRIAGLSAWCDFAGFRLEPGETTETERLRLAVGDDPYRQLERWADRAAEAEDARRWEDAPIGWLGWAWVDPFTVERYEDVVRRNVEAISSRLRGFGLAYVWVSIANLAGGTPGRWTEWNDRLFPSGPEYLRRLLASHGLKWGLWCAPFWICELAEAQLAELSEARLTGEHGEPLIAGPSWQFGDAGEMDSKDRPPIFALDPSHPLTQRFLSRVFDTYRKWGVRYFMIDFLEAGAGNISRYPYETHADSRLVAGPEVYHAGLEVVRRAAGDDTYLLTSSGPSVHNTGFADAARTGSDFGEGRALYRDSYFYPATFVINGTGFWTGPGWALRNQAAAYYTHRRLYLNDSGNVLTVDSPIPRSDAEIHATIHVMSGGPSMIGDDIDRIADDRLALIKATLPRPREVARPVDLFSSVYPDYPKVFHRRVEKPGGRYDVVAVYNFDESPLSQTVALADVVADVDRSRDRTFVLWEFWNREYLGTIKTEFTASVPPRSVRVYRITEAMHPVIAGTDMHILMGETELLDWRWDADSMTLSGSVWRPEGERGRLFVHAPEGYRVLNPEGLSIAKDARDHSLIIGVRFSFGRERERGSTSGQPKGADGAAAPQVFTVRFARVAEGVETANALEP